VYVSRWHHGSPAHRYSLYALHWLTQLNGQPVPDLDAFVTIVKTLPDKSFARLKLCQLETTKTKVSSGCNCLLTNHSEDASLIDWISDARSQGYAHLQSLAQCLDRRGCL